MEHKLNPQTNPRTIQEIILNEVNNSSWQPKFKFTDDLDLVVDTILKPHEDYHLGLHAKLKEIILRETTYVEDDDESSIKFNHVAQWQNELFKNKKELAEEKGITNLPNMHINLGLRQTNVKVGDWIPPNPIFLEELKSMCFPVDFHVLFAHHDFNVDPTSGEEHEFKVDLNKVNDFITNYYKTFETIHFFEDLNGRLGGILVAVISYGLTGQYLVKDTQFVENE